MADDALDFFCSQLSLDARERTFGTASSGVEVWLLLEYDGLWSRRLLPDSRLPPEVKCMLSETLQAVPGSRLLFIKNELRGTAGRSFFVAITREQHQALFKFELDDYRDLAAIDVAALATGNAAAGAQPVRGPLYLVCVNGKHDRCCAKFGLPVYRALARWAGEAVWQSSHVGGDRFAANVVCLPSGIYYGHVKAGEARRLADDTAAGLVYLDRFRGRSCYPFDVQAAEYFARVASGRSRMDAFRLNEVSRSEGVIRVRLDEPGQGRMHELELVRESAALRNYLNCGATRQSDVPRYVLRSYRAL